MPTLPPRRLAALLHADAAGSYDHEAATRLLVEHDRWLHRPEFLAACIALDNGQDGRPYAAVCWSEVPAFLDRHGHACSSSEARMLRLAAELAGVDCGRPLASPFSSLDDHNARIALAALTHVLTRGGTTR